MASITADSEFMTNYVAASSVPAGSHFVTLLDEHDHPMVVSLSDNETPKLLMVRESTEGVRYQFNLGKCLGLSDDVKVEAFDILQEENKTLYISVAYINEDPTYNSTNILLARPCRPTIQEGHTVPTIPGDAKVGTVRRIFMTPMPTLAQSDAEYPLVILTHKNLDQLSSWGDDITQVMTRPHLSGWYTSKMFSPPVNVAGILDIAPATNRHGQGIFVLYKTSSGESRAYGNFIKPDDQSSTGTLFRFATEVTCPANATSLSSMQDSRKASAVLLGSPQGLHYLTSSQAIEKRDSQLIVSEGSMKGCNNLITVEDRSLLAIWFTSSTGELGYIRTTIEDLEALHIPEPVLLMPAGEVTNFAPAISAPSTGNGEVSWQTLICNDRFGNLTLLEQAADIGLWRSKPFYSDDENENYEVESYSITIIAHDSDGSGVQDGSIRVTAASAVTGILNGAAVTLSPIPTWYKADTEGMLNLIIPTEAMASQALVIDGLRDEEGNNLPIQRVEFDPNHKVMDNFHEKLESLETVEDLKNSKTQNGEPLFDLSPDDMPTDEDLSNALVCFKQLDVAYGELPASGNSTTFGEISGDELNRGGARGFFGGVWNWVKRNVRAATDWLVRRVGNVWHFVCRIAGEVWDFIIDTIEKIGEALTWIWEKIKIGVQKVIQFIGFIFNWDDIIATKNQICTILTAGCELVANKLGSAADKVDEFFNPLLADIDNVSVTYDVDVSPNSGEEDDASGEVSDANNSTSANWASERMKNGGLRNSNAVRDDNDPQDDSEKTWTEVFEPALEEIQDAIADVGEEITNVWVRRRRMRASDYLALSKSVLRLSVQTIRKLVVSLIESMQKLIREVSHLGNRPIRIPVFSRLWRWISGHDLTIFDAISLIVAIPTTIITKIYLRKAPPIIPNMDATLLDGLILHNPAVPIDPQTRIDFNTITSGLTVSISKIKTVVHLIKYFHKMATRASGGVLKTVGGSRFMLLFTVALDMFSVINLLSADDSIPGLVYREWISYLSLINSGAQVLTSFVSDQSRRPNIVREKLLLVLDLATCLTVFGLWQAVGASEIKSRDEWEDYNLPSTVLGIKDSVLNGVAGVGHFTAYMFQKNLKVSMIGLAVLEGSKFGGGLLKGIKWNVDHRREVNSYFVADSC